MVIKKIQMWRKKIQQNFVLCYYTMWNKTKKNKKVQSGGWKYFSKTENCSRTWYTNILLHALLLLDWRIYIIEHQTNIEIIKLSANEQYGLTFNVIATVIMNWYLDTLGKRTGRSIVASPQCKGDNWSVATLCSTDLDMLV